MFDAKDKKEKGLFLRSLTLILAILITVSMMPAAAFAADDTSDGYVFETFKEYSTFTSGDTLKDSFYYTDEWFNKDPADINHSLALLSMQLSAAAVTDETEGYGADMLGKMGFESIGFAGFGTDDPDDCAYTWAKKSLMTDRLKLNLQLKTMIANRLTKRIKTELISSRKTVILRNRTIQLRRPEMRPICSSGSH